MGVYGGGQNIVTDGLVFYVDVANKESYSGSGTIWNDMVGGNNGTLENGPTFDSGNGGTISFDGTDDYVLFSNNTTIPNLNTLTDVTFCGFFNCNSFLSDRQLYSWGANNGLRFRINNGGNSVRLLDRGGTNSPSFNISLSLNTWYFYCTIANSSGLTVFINNTKLTGGSAFNPTLEDNSFYIGTFNAITEYMSGKIASTFLYTKSLSDDEVLQNYNALKGRFGL